MVTFTVSVRFRVRYSVVTSFGVRDKLWFREGLGLLLGVVLGLELILGLV